MIYYILTTTIDEKDNNMLQVRVYGGTLTKGCIK